MKHKENLVILAGLATLGLLVDIVIENPNTSVLAHVSAMLVASAFTLIFTCLYMVVKEDEEQKRARKYNR